MFFTRRRFFRTLAVLCLLALVAGCRPSDPTDVPNLSLHGFPSSEFFGGLSVDLDGLQNHPRYQLLPFDELIPATTSFDYLDTELISQFAIFLKTGSQSKQGSHQQFEIATIGKLRAPDSLDVKKELARWKNRTTPWRSDHAIELEEIQINNKTCFQFQSGTVLNSIRRQGKVEFYSRDGEKKERGINVGNATRRGYISGRDRSKAVINVAELTDSDLIDGALVLNLFLDVFRTRALKDQFIGAHAFLQTSDGKLRSSKVEIQARSFADHKLQFPRELPVFDVDSGEAKGTVDLINDFASDGKFQVVLQCLEESSYIGVQDSDFGLLLPRYEYLGTNGEFVVVTQSKESLKQILQLSPKQIAEKLSLQEDQQVSASFDLSSRQKRHSLKQFLSSLDMKHANLALPPSTKSVQLSINMDHERIFSARIEMSSSNAKSQAKQITEARRKLIAPRKFFDVEGRYYHLEGDEVKVLGELPTEVYDSVLSLDVMASLRTMALNMVSGLPSSTPNTSTLPTNSTVAKFPNESIDRESMAQLYQTLFEDLGSGLQVQRKSGDLVIEFRWPFDEPAQLDQMERLIFATLRRYRARDHFQQKRFFASEKIERRLIDDFPKEDGLWIALAHQLSFNTMVEFDADPTKYFWVQSGINLLLDVAESNENSVDATWMAANFIGLKIGSSHDEVAFRKLFANDKELLDRISKYIAPDQCLDASGELNCELVAQALLKHCNQRVEGSEQVNSNIAKIERAIQPIIMLEKHAQWLDSQLQFQAANERWQQVSMEFQQLGEQIIECAPETKLKLNELKAKASKLSDHDDSDAAVAIRLNASWYESKTRKIQFRLSPKGETVAKHISKAQAFRAGDEPEQALSQTKLALEAIRGALEQEPEYQTPIALLFGEFLEDTEARYRELDKPLSEAFRDLRLQLMPTSKWN